MKVLFFGESISLAHVARPATLAKGLKDYGHTVSFAFSGRYNDVLNLGANYISIDTIEQKQFFDNIRKWKSLYDEQTIRTYVEADIAVIEREVPDIVIGDFRHSLIIAAQKCKVPFYTISNAYWSPRSSVKYKMPIGRMTRLFGERLTDAAMSFAGKRFLNKYVKVLNRVADRFGVSARIRDLKSLHTFGDLALFADSPAMYDFAESDREKFIGPIRWSPEVEVQAWWDEIPDDKPIAYLCLGSSVGTEKLKDIERRLTDSMTVIVATAGKCDPSRFEFGANYLPGERAAKKADVVICNGGSPGTHQAIFAGTPIVGIPDNLDQLLNMQVIENAGVGVTSRHENKIKQAVAAAMGLTEKVKRLSEVFSDCDPVDQLNKELNRG